MSRLPHFCRIMSKYVANRRIIAKNELLCLVMLKKKYKYKRLPYADNVCLKENMNI